MLEALHNFIDPQVLINTVGTAGVIGIIFIETGLLIGFFFPGDSLLFTAGFLASQGFVSLPWLLAGTFIAAVVGDSVGYAFGKKVGPSIFKREDSVIFNKKNIIRAQEFYEKHGKKTIIIARFMPIIRTFAPIIAGVGTMNYRTFLTYNIIGAFIWTWGMLWLGYGLGALIPNPDRYILPIVGIIILTTAGPVVKKVIQEGWKKMKEVDAQKNAQKKAEDDQGTFS